MYDTIIFYVWTMEEAIIFLTFLFVCAALTKSRFNVRKTTAILLIGMLFSSALTTVVFWGSDNVAFALRMLPLTAYIPAILVLHILSDSGFFKTVPIWCIGLLVMYIGYLIQKTTKHMRLPKSLSEYTSMAIEILLLLVVMSAICVVIVKYIRGLFQQSIRYSDLNWSVPLALLLLIMALFSYFYNSTYNSVATLLLLLIAVVSSLVIIKLFRTEFTRQHLKKEYEENEIRLKVQQKEFMEITHKHEMLREYRHDMRHHLLALDNIIQDSDNTHAEEYIHSLMERLEETENIVYCKNHMVNAVLSSYINKAKEIGCELELNISIPEKLNIEDVDLCSVLSNALENAIHACEKEVEKHRYIKIKINYYNSLVISIKNGCKKTVAFDKNGLPIAMKGQEHGIGMKSMNHTIKKYNGIMKCEWLEDEFRLHAILFNIVEKNNRTYVKKAHKPASATLFSIVCICAFLNLSPNIAETLADVPIVGSVVQVITARNHRYTRGHTRFEANEPKIELVFPRIAQQESMPEHSETKVVLPTPATLSTLLVEKESSQNPISLEETSNEAAVPTAGPKNDAVLTQVANNDALEVSITIPAPEAVGFDESCVRLPAPDFCKMEHLVIEENIVKDNPALEEGIEDMNDKLNDYIKVLREKFDWYVERKYMGYVALEADYTILCNNEDLLTIRFDTTINIGGSADFSRCFSLDKRTGSVIELVDLFQDGADYITPISSYILEEMTRQVENGTGNYYIPGGIWLDDECFKSISKEQNFYINGQRKLVITFDEYEVAPGSMGCVEFVIPMNVIEPILLEPSLIQ